MTSKYKPTILVFSDWYKPGYKGGGPIQSLVNFSTNLREAYELFVFTGDRDMGDTDAYAGIATDQWLESDTGEKIFYASRVSLTWGKIKSIINEVTPDWIYLNSMFSKYFTVYPLLMKRLGLIQAQVALAPRGMLQAGAVTFKKKKKLTFLTALRIAGIPKYITGHATDEQEKKDFLYYFPNIAKVVVIPNFSGKIAHSTSTIEKVPGKIKLIFISRISPKKNLLFILKLLIEIKSHIEFDIYGTNEDQEYWNECLRVINTLPNNIKIVENGPLPNDKVTQVIQSSHLFVLPTLGENFGHAIFESLAAGRPVLISDQTPWRKLQSKSVGWDIPLIAFDSFVSALEQAASWDQNSFDQWCANAMAYASEKQNKDSLTSAYKQLFATN